MEAGTVGGPVDGINIGGAVAAGVAEDDGVPAAVSLDVVSGGSASSFPCERENPSCGGVGNPNWLQRCGYP